MTQKKLIVSVYVFVCCVVTAMGQSLKYYNADDFRLLVRCLTIRKGVMPVYLFPVRGKVKSGYGYWGRIHPDWLYALRPIQQRLLPMGNKKE